MPDLKPKLRRHNKTGLSIPGEFNWLKPSISGLFMIYSRFPLLLALCLVCLGVAPSNTAARELTLNHSTVSRSLPETEPGIQIVAAAPSATVTPQSAYDRYMQAGYEATQKKSYKTALESFKKALTERPKDIYAQQAIQNLEIYLAKEKLYSNNPLFNPLLLLFSVAIAGGTGGALFFLLWRLRRSQTELGSEAVVPEVENVMQQPDSFNSKQASATEDRTFSQESDRLANRTVNLQPASSSSTTLQTTTRLPNVDLVEELIHDLRASDPKKRRKAIWELAQKSDSRAMKPLVDLMLDADSQERSLILEALSQISTRTLKPMNQALAVSLQDQNPQVRKNAIRDLTRIYDLMSQISQLLCHAIDDGDKEVKETAKWALNQLNLQMPPKLELVSSRREKESQPRENSYSESSDYLE